MSLNYFNDCKPRLSIKQVTDHALFVVVVRAKVKSSDYNIASTFVLSCERSRNGKSGNGVFFLSEE